MFRLPGRWTHGRSGAVFLLPIVTAVAGAPLGGDDFGFVPPNRRAAQCEEVVARNLARFSSCLVGCEVRAARAAFRGRGFDSLACKQTGPRSCRASYERASARIARGGRCPACLAPPAEAALADRATTRLEADAGLIYCRAAPDASALKCENAVAGSLARILVCIASCHLEAASAGLKSRAFDEEDCEHSCRLAYDRAGARLGAGCPPCLAGPQQADLADRAEAALDEESGDVFCAGSRATTTSTTPAGPTTSTTATSSTTSTAAAATTTSTTLTTSTTSAVSTSSTTSTTLGCAGEGNPCGPTLDGCGARMVCVDGALVCRGSFVAPPPLGDPANPGTQAAPLSTLGAGIGNAAGLGVEAVCACAGAYFEDLTVVEGISLRGGYDCHTWTRDLTTNVTAVTGLPPDGMKIPSGVTAATSLDGLTVAGGADPFSVASSALTVTDASPTLKDLTVTDRAVVTSQLSQTLYGLHIRQTGTSPASPTIVNGTYRTLPSAGGKGIAIFIEGASPSLTNVIAYGTPTDSFPSGATAVGIRCVDCAGTTIVRSGIVGGSATMMSVGLWASGDVNGLAAGDMSFFWGGNAPSGVSYGTLLDDCAGASTWSVASLGFFHDTVASNSIGFSASGASCRPTVTGSLLVGCELAGYCAALQCTGAPCTVTDSTLDATFDASGYAVESYGARCLEGGCALLARNRISVGNVYESHLEPAEGIGVDIEAASPTLDANVIDGPSCSRGLFGSSTLAALQLRGSLSLVTNNLLRGGPCPAASEVVRVIKKSNGADVLAPTLENNTLEYSPCPTCGAHTGLFVRSPGDAAPGGSVRNNILHDATPGGPSFAIYEADASSDLAALENNDLDDPTGVLYYDEGTTPLTLADVNALPGAAGNISADPLLDTTGHIAAQSPCRNTGTATGAPSTDRDGDSRPQEGAFDIGADEFVP